MNYSHALCLLTLSFTLLACGDEASSPESEPSPDAVTWYGDVAHVATDKCMGCHNDDAPTFSMLRFSDELKARAPLMAAYTADGTMPPWKPSPDCNSFAHERRLTDDEKALFQAWADAGAPEGDPADAPPPRKSAEKLPRVDSRLEMADSYLPAPPEGDANDLHCFVLDPDLAGSEQLIGFDILPGEKAVVHHALLYLADASEAQALDESEPGIGYSCFGGPIAASSQVVAGWVPGMPATTYPEGTGIPIAPGKVLIMQIHYNTMQAGPLPDQTAVELMFAETEMDNTAQIQALRNGSFVIPPQTNDFTATASVDVPGNATIWAVAPHMHLLGRRALIEVEHDNGDTTCLVDIPDWDFDWQQFYFFDSPTGIPLEAGDRVKLSCTWDNDTMTEVRWGDGTEDEMCISYAFVTAGHVD
jgi:hypothetical protein